MKFTYCLLILGLFASLFSLNWNKLEPAFSIEEEKVLFSKDQDNTNKPNLIDCIKIVDDENPDGDFA